MNQNHRLPKVQGVFPRVEDVGPNILGIDNVEWVVLFALSRG